VNIKIAGKWMFIPLKMVLIGIDPYPFQENMFIKPWGNAPVISGRSFPKREANGFERKPPGDITLILLMAEILHHLGWLKPCK
jgi:hypothetical protein